MSKGNGVTSVISILFAVTGTLWGGNGLAAYPDKPIRMILPFAPGGGVDVVARILAEKLRTNVNQPIVIDNRAGGGGSIAPDIVAKSPADGYTILYISLSNVINSVVYPKLPYDLLRDFEPVTQVSAQPNILLVIPSVPVKSVKELVALARAKPNQLNFASDGKGSFSHLATELFKKMAGIEMVHIPYKGSAPSMVDMYAGRVEVKLASITLLPQARTGKLRILGVSTPERYPLAPDIPAIAEELPGFACVSWHGILAPAKTPSATVRQLNEEIVKILQTTDIKNRLASEGSITVGSSPQQFKQFLREEKTKWSKTAADANIRMDD